MPRLIDISPTLSARTAVWPGDTPFSRIVNLDMARGDNLTLSAISSTVHLGAHADARNHYLKTGLGIAEHPLEPYYGPCQVMSVRAAPGARLRVADLSAPIAAPRLLLRTRSAPDPHHFNTDFNSLSPELIAFLQAENVILVGIDTPSIDPYDDALLESHQAMAAAGLYNLEGLTLDSVADGLYELSAFPLKLAEADAAPVRAVLILRD